MNEIAKSVPRETSRPPMRRQGVRCAEPHAALRRAQIGSHVSVSSCSRVELTQRWHASCNSFRRPKGGKYVCDSNLSANRLFCL